MSVLEQTTRLNVLDELYLHLGREEEPWSVHLEIRVEGRVDRRRLESAVREAAAGHPIIRARLGHSRRGIKQSRYPHPVPLPEFTAAMLTQPSTWP
jgi:hypothetical protein